MSPDLPATGGEIADSGADVTGIDLVRLAALANDLFRSAPGHDLDEPLPTGRAALGRVDSPVGLTPPPHALVPQSVVDLPNPPVPAPAFSELDQHVWSAPTRLHDPEPGVTDLPLASSTVPSAVPSAGPDPGVLGGGLPRGSAPSSPTIPTVTPAAGTPAATTGAYYFLDEATALRDTPVRVDAPSGRGVPTGGGVLPDQLLLQPDQLLDAPVTTVHPDRYYLPVGGSAAPDVRPIFDVATVRRDFPILSERINGRQITWLDNAATTQKPRSVIDRLSYFYEHENSNIHRAAHTLAARATDAYEAAREKVRHFLNAGSTDEIIFVRGATEGINFVAKSWGWRHVNEGDEIVITWLEHHANIVPWQQLCAAKGATLKVAPVDDSGQILLDEYEKLFTPKTRLASLTQVSNALGTVTPVKEMVEIAHRHGACVVVDGAQSVSHMAVDVQSLGCDFFIFSGHKVFGPTGIGAVYGRREVLEQTPPWQGGGNMIADVTFEKTLYQPPPHRFEAGTGNIADAVGLGAAIDYVEQLGMHNIAAYEHELLVYGSQRLQTVPGLTLIGTAKEKASVLSFTLDGWKTEEVGKALDKDGIAVRSGHHCAQPILRRFGLEATVRPSLAFYNTCEDIDALVAALIRLQSGHNR